MPVACSEDSGAGIASDRNPYPGYYRPLPQSLSFGTGDPIPPTAVNFRSSPAKHVLQHEAGAAGAPDAVAEIIGRRARVGADPHLIEGAAATGAQHRA